MSLSAGVNLNVKYFPPTSTDTADVSGTLQQILRLGYSLQNDHDDILLKLDNLEEKCGNRTFDGYDEIVSRLDGILSTEERNHNQVMTKLDEVLTMGAGSGSGEPQPCNSLGKSNFMITDLVEHRQKLTSLQGMVDFIRADVLEYHDLFDELYRASELVRIQQKKGFRAQIIEITEIHAREIEVIKSDMRKALQVVPAEIAIEPANAPVTEELEPYIRESILTGKPLFELLPPSLLVSRLHYFSSGGSTNASSSNSSGKLTSSASGRSSSASSSSSSSGSSKIISSTSITAESADSPATSTSASSGDETGLPRIIQAGSSSATTMSVESEDSPYTSSSSSSASSDADPNRFYSSSSSSSSDTVESLDSPNTSTSESSGDENHLDKMMVPGSTSATTMSEESADSPWTSSSSEDPDSDVPPP